MRHDYSDPQLATLLAKALAQYEALVDTLREIQTATGIPGFHTDIDSEDWSEGVLQRIQAMHDEGETSLECFKEFD